MVSALVKATFSFGTLVALVILAGYYDEPFFELSLKWIPEMQAGAS